MTKALRNFPGRLLLVGCGNMGRAMLRGWLDSGFIRADAVHVVEPAASLREEAGAQSLWLARYTPDLSKELQRTKLADLQGKGRATGFPKLVLKGAAAHVVWTDVVDGVPELRGLRLLAAK